MPARLRLALLFVSLAVALALPTACEQERPREAAPPPPPVTVVDAIGRWVIEPSAYHNAAFNTVLNAAERAGREASDAEIERIAEKIFQAMDPGRATYTFNADNTFIAQIGEQSAKGRWSLEGDTLTIEGENSDRPARFNLQEGLLTLIPATERGRVITLVRG